MAQQDSLLLIVAPKILNDILTAFSMATGLRAFIVDPEGHPILTPKSEFRKCKFCKTVWGHQGGFNRCQGAYKRAGKQAAQLQVPYIFRCPSGLVEWAAPIIIKGNHYASIICGQVLMWEPEDFFWTEVEQMNKDIGVNIEKLKEAAKELEIISGPRVQAAADLLFLVANQIMRTGLESMQQKEKITKQRAMIKKEIRNRRALEQELKEQSQSLDHALEIERELVSKLKLGDQEGAKKALNELMADMFAQSTTDIDIIKARVLELAVVLSRAAIEGGAKAEETILNYQQFKEIEGLEATQEIQQWITRVVEQFLEAVCNTQNVKNHHLIQQVTKYLRENYHRNLTLEEISKVVFLSPYYLSHLFKAEQGITVMDYLTKVRIEEAKNLLRNPQYNVIQVAEMTGYNDPSYFSRVFKKNSGMSPTQYKNNAL